MTSKKNRLPITNRMQLKKRISELNRAMDQKEEELKSDLHEVHQSLRASNMIRNAIKDLREQPELRVGIAQAATDLGAHALIDKIVFRKNKGLKNFLVSLILKKIADHFILKDRAKVQHNAGI